MPDVTVQVSYTCGVQCKEILDAARAALQGNKRYLLGDTLTFVDLSFAASLNMLAIHPDLP